MAQIQSVYAKKKIDLLDNIEIVITHSALSDDTKGELISNSINNFEKVYSSYKEPEINDIFTIINIIKEDLKTNNFHHILEVIQNEIKNYDKPKEYEQDFSIKVLATNEKDAKEQLDAFYNLLINHDVWEVCRDDSIRIVEE